MTGRHPRLVPCGPPGGQVGDGRPTEWPGKGRAAGRSAGRPDWNPQPCRTAKLEPCSPALAAILEPVGRRGGRLGRLPGTCLAARQPGPQPAGRPVWRRAASLAPGGRHVGQPGASRPAGRLASRRPSVLPGGQHVAGRPARLAPGGKPGAGRRPGG